MILPCFNCSIDMICYDDVNDVSTRIDWFKCPNCNSIAEIRYGGNGRYVLKVVWDKR